MIVIVSYELKSPSTSYSALYEFLKSHESWAHYLASTWLIKTDKSPATLSDEIKAFIVPGDRVLITEFTGQYNGWLPKKAWEWVAKNKTS
jgi:hypothetical protein